jgi:hypothetical protein
MVIAPPRPAEGGVFPGWWQVDPATGTTLGIGPSGHGQAMVEYALIIIIETMMAAAQCALAASLTKALERTLAEKAKGSDSGVATGAGARAGFEQAKKDLGNTQTRNQCIATGMFAGFKSLLLGFALHAARTAGDKGYDGSKRPNSFEQNAVNNARNGSRSGGPGPSANPGRTGPNLASNGPGSNPGSTPPSSGQTSTPRQPGAPQPGESPPTLRSPPIPPGVTPNPKGNPNPAPPVSQPSSSGDSGPNTQRSPGAQPPPGFEGPFGNPNGAERAPPPLPNLPKPAQEGPYVQPPATQPSGQPQGPSQPAPNQMPSSAQDSGFPFQQNGPRANNPLLDAAPPTAPRNGPIPTAAVPPLMRPGMGNQAAPPSSGQMLTPRPVPANGNSGFAGPAAPNGAEAAKTSGLAGLTSALETVSKP